MITELPKLKSFANIPIFIIIILNEKILIAIEADDP
jgi:hypothetical protein